jgi:hypothetical protein
MATVRDPGPPVPLPTTLAEGNALDVAATDVAAATDVDVAEGVATALGADGSSDGEAVPAGWSVGPSATVAVAATAVTVGAPAWQAATGNSAAPAVITAARPRRIGA